MMQAAPAIAPPPLRGIPTFLGAPIAELEELRPGDVALLGLFLDHGDSSRFGKRFAARQLRYASALACLRPPDGPRGRCLDLGDLNVFPLEPARQAAAFIRQLGAVAETGAPPIVVGGRELPIPVSRCLPDGCARDVRLPGYPPIAGSAPIALVVDLSPLFASFAVPRAASGLTDEITRIRPERIAAVHLTGFAPDLDVGGRREASLAATVLSALAAHLTGATPCR